MDFDVGFIDLINNIVNTKDSVITYFKYCFIAAFILFLILIVSDHK